MNVTFNKVIDHQPQELTVEKVYDKLKQQLIQEFPQLPLKTIEKRTDVLTQTTTQWLDQHAEIAFNLVNSELDKTLDAFNEFKRLEERDAEVSKRIVECACESISRLERLNKTVVQIEKTQECKSKISTQLEYLDDLEKKIHKTNVQEDTENDTTSKIYSILGLDYEY